VQGFVALHVPRQAGSTDALVCNCRAETVPAKRTAMVIAAKKEFWDIFFMMRLPFNSRPDEYARP
jgi:hypothetical protein